jgi:hypothetical protein
VESLLPTKHYFQEGQIKSEKKMHNQERKLTREFVLTVIQWWTQRNSPQNVEAALSRHHTDWPIDYGFSTCITSYLSSTCRNFKHWFSDSVAS